MEAIFIILLVAIGLFVSSFRLVRQTDMFVVERLGGYFKTWDTGIHLLIPFIDKVAKSFYERTDKRFPTTTCYYKR